MGNYVYIISSLPVISRDVKSSSELDTDAVVAEIKERCSEADRRLVDLLLETGTEGKADAAAYMEVKSCRKKFIREYFRFELCVRNEKVRFINAALGRPEGTDEVSVEDYLPSEEEISVIRSAYENPDLLSRERALDDLTWNKADELSEGHYLDFDVILAFLVKIRIVGRWLHLDEQRGREMFRKLVDEVRSTFKGVEFDN